MRKLAQAVLPIVDAIVSLRNVHLTRSLRNHFAPAPNA